MAARGMLFLDLLIVFYCFEVNVYLFIGSRVKSEWRVEGESHSLTDVLNFWFLPCAATLLYSGDSTLGEHNGTF